MNREQVSNIDGEVALNTTTTSTANSVTNGNIIDTRGAEALTILVQSGTMTAGSFTLSLTEGDSATLADGATVSSDDLILSDDLEIGATEDDAIKIIGYRGNKRYVRLDATGDGSINGTVSATAFRGYLSHSPA